MPVTLKHECGWTRGRGLCSGVGTGFGGGNSEICYYCCSSRGIKSSRGWQGKILEVQAAALLGLGMLQVRWQKAMNGNRAVVLGYRNP